MGFFSSRMAAQNESSMNFEINRLARSMSALVLSSVDGSNADERRLLLSAKKLGELAGSRAPWRVTASYLLATSELAVEAVDFSTRGEKQLYYEALELVQQFEFSRASCA